jgi:hypothetical protein
MLRSRLVVVLACRRRDVDREVEPPLAASRVGVVGGVVVGVAAAAGARYAAL